MIIYTIASRKMPGVQNSEPKNHNMMPKEHKTSSAKVPSSVDVRNDVESSKKHQELKRVRCLNQSG